MERIWPLGRMVAVPPPLSDTCRPGAGLFTDLVPPAFPLFAELGPPARLLPEGVPVFPLPLPVVEVPLFAPVAVPGLPPLVPLFETVPGRFAFVFPGLVLEECVAVEGLLDFEGALA